MTRLLLEPFQKLNVAFFFFCSRQDAYESKEPRTEDLSILSGVDSDSLYAVFVTYVEIYNNSVFDLLESQSTDSRAK